MSSLNSLTGRNGKFVVVATQVARTTKWDINSSMASKSEWGDSDSAGYTNRAPGRRDATFDSEGKYDTAHEQFDLFVPGDISLAALWMDASALYWAFPRALCLDFKISVNIETEEVIGWQSSWGADGVYYHPGQSGTPVYTLP
jgi:hypothetical protein